MSDGKLIVEVGVENGLPGTEWKIEKDPRLLLAVAYELKNGARMVTPNADKFIAMWKEGFVELTVPVIDGGQEAFRFILAQTLESMAKVLIEMEWGAKIMAEMQERVARAKVAVPGRIVL